VPETHRRLGPLGTPGDPWDGDGLMLMDRLAISKKVNRHGFQHGNYPLVMTNRSPWYRFMAHRNRCFSELNSMVDLSMAICECHNQMVIPTVTWVVASGGFHICPTKK